MRPALPAIRGVSGRARDAWRAAGLLVASGVLSFHRMKKPLKRDARFLDGQLLVAMPGMTDARFERAVIFLCAHSADGAMGIIVNQPAKQVSFRDLLVQLDIVGEREAGRLPAEARAVPVISGGPVETGRGFVLHSADYFVDSSTLAIDGAVSLTATIDILRAIATGKGPGRAVLALGYAGWSAGQLEDEIVGNGWLHCPADQAIIFDRDLDSKYDRALRQLGIDPAMLSSEAGHA